MPTQLHICLLAQTSTVNESSLVEFYTCTWVICTWGSVDMLVIRGGDRHFHLGGATGGARFATRGAVNGLRRTSMQWHDVTRKILGGPGKTLGGQWPPLAPPLAPPLLVINIAEICFRLRLNYFIPLKKLNYCTYY